MEFLQFYIARVILPVAFTAIFILLQLNGKELLKKIKNRKKRLVLEYYLEGLKIKIGDWKKTIMLPAALAIGLDILVSWTYKMPMHASGEPLVFAMATSGFLNPIYEEFAYRGIGIGMIVVPIAETARDKTKKYAIYLAGMLMIAYVFTISHDNGTVFQFISRFSLSMLFGLLYLFSGRNLLPPMIAHAASNLFMVLKDSANCT